MAKLLEPKLEEFVTQSGETRKYFVSKFPAIAGREIIAKYPLSAMPKLGDYQVNEETMIKLMAYVAVPVVGAEPIRLETVELINNHVPDWETLAKIEAKVLEYNCSFFTQAGAIHGFIDLLLERAAPMLSAILTTSLQALSAVAEQAGSNSESK